MAANALDPCVAGALDSKFQVHQTSKTKCNFVCKHWTVNTDLIYFIFCCHVSFLTDLNCQDNYLYLLSFVSHLISSHLISSHLILSYPISSHLILSYLILLTIGSIGAWHISVVLVCKNVQILVCCLDQRKRAINHLLTRPASIC